MGINLSYDPQYGTLTNRFLEFRADLAQHLEVDSDSVIPTNGATGGLDAIFSATGLHHGRKRVALLASLEYFDALRMLGLYEYDLTTIPNDGICYPTAKVIDALKRVCPDLYYISVPNNPTGFLLPQEDLDELLNAIESGTRVVIDKTLVHPDQYCSARELIERYGDKDIVLVDSFSKSHGLVQERVGCIVTLRKETARCIHPFAHAPNAVGMSRATAALENVNFLHAIFAKIQESHNLLSAWDRTQKFATYYPSNANFACIELRKMSGSECKRQLLEKGVRLRSGKDLFIDDKYIRIAMEQPESIPEFLSLLDQILIDTR